jgi:HK97 family phage portal protein
VNVPRTASNSRGDTTDPYSRRNGSVYSQEKMHAGDGLSYRLMMSMAGDAQMSRPYAQHPWVHACVAATARAVCSVPLVVQRRMGEGFEPVESGPLSDLLAMPNALMSQRKFLESVTQTQRLYGETFLIMMVKDNGVVRPIQPTERVRVPDELWPVRGDLLEEIIDDRTQLPRAWRMATKQGQVLLDADSVVQIADANPYNPLRGMGPMQAAYRTAAKDFVLDRYDEALLANGGSPGGVLSVDGHLTDADSRAIQSAWREAHERPDAHRKTAVLPQGTSYEQIGFTPSEMEFGEMRAWNRETIMSIFGVTKPIIGLTEGLNYASSQSAFRSFWEVTIIPFLDFLADEITCKFVRRLQGPESQYVVGFDTSAVAALREDSDAKIKRMLDLFTQGGRTFTEAAELAGLDLGDVELQHLEQAYMPSGQVPIPPDGGEVPQTPAPGEQPAPDPEEDVELDDDDEDEDEALDDAEEPSEEDAPNRSYNTLLPRFDSAERYWEDWDRSIQKTEDRLAKAVKRVLRSLTLAMRRRFREEAANPSGLPRAASSVTKAVYSESEIQRLLDLNYADWSDQMVKAADPHLARLIAESATGVSAELGGSAAVITATDPTALKYLASKELVLANVPTSLRDEILRSMVSILSGAETPYASLREALWFSMSDIEAKFNTTLGNLGTRAQLIARTETTGAANYARMEQMARDGVATHIWMAQPSARPEHAELDGREVPIGDEFGYSLRYPGDYQAGPAMVCNCRCMLLPGKRARNLQEQA